MTLSRLLLASALVAGCVTDSKSLGNPETDTGETGDDATTGELTPPALQCDASCRPIPAYPADVDRGCVDTTTSVIVGCDCNPNFGGAPGCVRWEEDGTLWMAENTDDLLWDENSGEPATPLDNGWVHCSNEEYEHTRWSCDFESCILPPPSTCGVAETCEALNSWGITCGDIASSHDGAGCLRPSCETDSDCGEGQGCLVVECWDLPTCLYENEGTCQCAGVGDGPCSSHGYCVDASVAGAWSTFEILQGAGPCEPGEICEWTWTLEASGQVTTSKAGIPGQAQLTPEDLELVNIMLSSGTFRSDMAQGFTCGEPPTDVSVSFRLTLPAGALSQGVTGCAVNDDGSQADALFDIISEY